MKVARGDRYYLARGVIYGFNHQLSAGELEVQAEPNGTLDSSPFLNLSFAREDVCYISPTIILDNSLEADISGKVSLYDIKIRHLRTEYATGFEQPSGFIKMKVQNFNINMTQESA